MVTVVLCAVLLSAAGAAVVVIYNTEPTAQRTVATRKSAALVDTVRATRRSYRPRIVVLGPVEPARDIVLSPRVAGQVIELDPSFVPGGVVERDDLLLKIDPADFQTTVAMRSSDVREARAALAIEQGRKDVAEQEFALLNETIDEEQRALVLREPQIESARAQVESAQAALRRAELDLERTRITAPFDAQILSRMVNVGSQVSPSDELARLVGIDEYWVIATVPLRSLSRVQFPGRDVPGSRATLRDPGTWEPGASRRGRVARLIGVVDEQTRLARVLITVPDPLARETDGPPLVLGTLLEVEIEGRPIENVTRLSRDYVREDDTVWVMQDGKLSIRDTTVVFLDAQYAYIRDGLEDGDAVVTTTLATVAEGIALRRIGEAPDAQEPATAPVQEAE